MEASGRTEYIAIVSRSVGLGARVIRFLEDRGFQPQQFRGIAQLLVSLSGKVPDLLLFAGVYSETECSASSQQVRDVTRVPLLLLCDISGDGHVAGALRSGADDHAPTSIGGSELDARVTALLRRNQLSGQLQPETVHAGLLRLDNRRATCAVNGSEIRLTPKEFKLIGALAMRSGEILSHNELIEQIWGSPYHGSAENLRKLVQRTRSTLADIAGSHEFIAAVPGFGYRLKTGEEVSVA